MPSSAYDNFSIVSLDSADRATIQVEELANANIYAARTTMFGGTSLQYYERVRYKLQLTADLASKYKFMYVNSAPRITDPEPFNNQILVSIRWLPLKPEDPTALLVDAEGRNWDVLYLSGPIVDS